MENVRRIFIWKQIILEISSCVRGKRYTYIRVWIKHLFLFRYNDITLEINLEFLDVNITNSVHRDGKRKKKRAILFKMFFFSSLQIEINPEFLESQAWCFIAARLSVCIFVEGNNGRSNIGLLSRGKEKGVVNSRQRLSRNKRRRKKVQEEGRGIYTWIQAELITTWIEGYILVRQRLDEKHGAYTVSNSYAYDDETSAPARDIRIPGIFFQPLL